jgi:flagellar basal-body rod modification protein FlgD
MTAPVSGGSQATSTSTTSVDRPDQMDKDTFLKLLVAQMRYQDPSNPTDPTQFMSQTAAFTQVEKLEEIAKQNASLLALQRSSSAGALVGRSVTYTDDEGAKKSGVVTSVRLATDTSEARAMVGGVAVALGRITEIATTAPAPSSTSSSGSTSAS